MATPVQRGLRWLLLLICLGDVGAAAARDSLWQPGEENATWRSECGACHIAFAPAWLPFADWAHIMGQLREHFGSDASVDARTQQEITDFLQRNSSKEDQAARHTELPRMTRSERFAAKHRSAMRLWQKGKVKSLADCRQCHSGAESPAPKP